MILVRPIELRDANTFVGKHHRHHKPVVGHRFSLGAYTLRGLRRAWCADTSACPDWKRENPSEGQCAVTALVVQDDLGGDILRTTVRGDSHYLNRVDGRIHDETLEQFGGLIYDAEPKLKSRAYLEANEDTMRRYRLLRARIDEEILVGVCIVGRPVSRHYDPASVLEVTRLCTDGTRNACSILYGAAARAGRAMGFQRIQTYTLPEEGGASLRASGWVCEGEQVSKPWRYYDGQHLLPGFDNRRQDQPTGNKVRWALELHSRSTPADEEPRT